MEDSRKPLTAGEIEELAHVNREIQDCGGVWLDYQASKIVNALPRLLSLLTPHPDAELREAVERARRAPQTYEIKRPSQPSVVIRVDDIEVLIRAVQAPRLTPEQVERLRESADTLEAHGEALEAQWLRAAFPEAFAGEE